MMRRAATPEVEFHQVVLGRIVSYAALSIKRRNTCHLLRCVRYRVYTTCASCYVAGTAGMRWQVGRDVVYVRQPLVT